MNYEDQNTNTDYAAEFRSDVVQFGNKSTNVALFGADEDGREYRVEIPVELRGHKWVAALVHHINNSQFTTNQTSLKNNVRTFEYFLTIFTLKPDLNVRFLGFEFLEFIKNETHDEYVIWDLNSKARALFCGLSDTIDNYETKVIIREAAGRLTDWGNWPKTTRPESEPRLSLACSFGNELNATNEAFLSAFTDFNHTFISEWNCIRSELRFEHTNLYLRIVAFVERLGEERLNKLQSTRKISGARSKFKNDDLSDYEELMSLNVEILQTLQNPFLNCLAFAVAAGQKNLKFWADAVGWSEFNKDVYEQYFLDDQGSLRERINFTVSVGKYKYLNGALLFNLMDFLKITNEETMCLYWLLSMYRAPSSGIAELKLEDIGINDKNYYVRVHKSRNRKAENPNFPIASKQGRTLKAYLKSIEEQTLLNGCPPSEKLLNDFGNVGSSIWRLQNTNIFKFAQFFTVGRFSNSIIRVTKKDVGFTSMTDEAFNLVRDTFVSILDVAVKERHSLVPTKFSQAHVYAEQSKRGDFQKSNSMSNFTYDEEDSVSADIAARKNFHTFETQNTVYRARSRDKLVLKMGDDLGLAVNAEMGNIIDEILAKKLDPETGETRVLTHDEYRSAIGLMDVDVEASPEALRLAAQAQNFIVEESGLIEKDGQVIVIDDAMTAFLMSEKMKHIEEAAGEEFTNLVHNFGREQIIAILTEYWLLEALYERLSPTSRHAAKKPPYSNLVGKFKFSPIIAGGVL